VVEEGVADVGECWAFVKLIELSKSLIRRVTNN